jgi:hypothetical protein
MCLIFLVKLSNIKFYENPSGESKLVPCGRADMQTAMTNLILNLRSTFAEAPKNPAYWHAVYSYVSHNLRINSFS